MEHENGVSNDARNRKKLLKTFNECSFFETAENIYELFDDSILKVSNIRKLVPSSQVIFYVVFSELSEGKQNNENIM